MLSAMKLLPMVLNIAFLGFAINGYPQRERPFLFPDARLEPKLDQYGNPMCTLSQHGFCVEVPDYPINDIKQLIPSGDKYFKAQFPTGIIPRRTIPTNDSLEESICGYGPRTFNPKLGKNQDNKWRYVVNDIDYIQTVVSEVCKKADHPCQYLDGSLPKGYSSVCRQRYSYKKLWAIDPENKRTYVDSFKYPSCCSCFVLRTDILDRKRLSSAGTWN